MRLLVGRSLPTIDVVLVSDGSYLSLLPPPSLDGLQELRELNETYKLKMFKSLAWTLGTFVTLFTFLTVAMLTAEGSQQQSWQWKWEWVQVVSWEVREKSVNFRVAPDLLMVLQ